MKIIKNGKIPEEKSYQCSCNYCKTIFECQMKDGSLIADQRDGDSIKVDCPYCRRPVFISVNLFR